ncbi:MAG: hypothetical protein KDD64_17170, partial [Bdellovibrionales bacterium]|nr:hypothetical protein [Bdellovibrionales bacterium]
MGSIVISWRRFLVFFLLVALSPGVLHAEDTLYVPDELKPWRGWIEQAHPEWECAVSSDGSTTCQWPGRIRYELGDRGGGFQLWVELSQKGELALPSSPALVPHGVQVLSEDGSAEAFTTRLLDSRVLIKLPAGKFTVSGKFSWDSLPSELPLPFEYGLVELNHPKRELNFRRGNAAVWIE